MKPNIMKHIKYQLIKVKINSASESVRFSADTDKLYSRVEGLYVSLPYDNSHFGSTLELKIAEQEILPEGFETKLLAASQSTSPNERFFMLGKDENIEASGSKVEGRLTDGGFAVGVTFPYTAVIYLKLKNDITSDELASE